MKKQLQLAKERMQSNGMIELAQYFYDNRMRFSTYKEMSEDLGFSTELVRSRRQSLRLNFGFEFEFKSGGYQLKDITGKPNKRYKEQVKNYDLRRKAKLTKKVKVAASESFDNAFALMGV